MNLNYCKIITLSTLIFSSICSGLDLSTDPGRILQDTRDNKIQPKELKIKYPELKKRKVSKESPTSTTDMNVFRLTLSKIHTIGNTKISEENLTKDYKNKIGQQITNKELSEIVNHIKYIYNKKGYLLTGVNINNIDLEQGIIVLNIFEGFVNKIIIKIDDNITLDKSQLNKIKEYGKNIQDTNPLTDDVYEKNILLADDLPGINLDTTFVPSDSVVGAADLIINIKKYDKFVFFGGFNNQSAKNLGYYQTVLGGQINNGTHQTIIRGQQSINKKLQIASLEHSQFVGSNGLTPQIIMQHIKTKPNTGTDEIIKGTVNNLILRASYPFKKTLLESFYINTELDLNNIKNNNSNPNNSYYDKIRTLKFSTNWSIMDRYYGNNVLLPSVSFGLPILGESKTSSNQSRKTGKSKFSKLNFNYSRMQYLPNNFSALLEIGLQYSFTSLLTAEEFSFGGGNFGRGYEGSTITGDHGIAAKLDLKYDQYFNYDLLTNIEHFIFYDLGVVNSKKENKVIVNKESRKKASASSTGFGFKASGDYYQASLMFAKPLTFIGVNSRKDLRIIFGISVNI